MLSLRKKHKKCWAQQYL